MGRTAKSDTVQQNPRQQDAGEVQVAELQKYYDQGHSPAEVAEHFDVEEADVLEALDLVKQGEKPESARKAEQEAEAKQQKRNDESAPAE